MAKTSGGVRTLRTGSGEYATRQVEVEQMRSSGNYSSVEFSNNGGGYVAIEKSSMKHKPEEIEAARFLANKGYKVILKDEVGELKTPDGQIFSFTFEQRTPTGNSATNIRNSLTHAQSKRAEIAVMYMKNNKHTRQSVTNGIKLFEDKGDYRFKQIIVITTDGRIHKHRHNK